MASDSSGQAPESALAAAYRSLALRLRELATAARAREAEGTARYIDHQVAAVEQALAQATTAGAAFVAESVPKTYARSAAAASETLIKAGLESLRPGFTGIDQRSVEALQRRVSTQLGAVREALEEGLALGDRRLAAKRLEQVLAGDSRFAQVRPDGKLSVLTQSGRLWEVGAYARMLGRTAIADARRTAFRQRYTQNGVDVVRVVPNGTFHDVCARWEGELLSLTGATPGLPTVAEAEPDGLFHPNCRHRYVMATPQELEAAGLAEPAVPLQAEPGAEELPARPILGQPSAATPAPVVPPPATPAPAPPPPPKAPAPKAPAPARARRPRTPKPAAPAPTPARRALPPLDPSLAVVDGELLGSARPTHFKNAMRVPSARSGETVAQRKRRIDKQNEHDVVEHYVGTGYEDIRQDVAAGRITHSVRTLDRVVNRSQLPRDMELYRGIRWPGGDQARARLRAVFGDFKVGHTYTEKSFQSWSYDKRVAINFTAGEEDVVFRMVARKGSKGFLTGTRENEAVLPRDARYRIVRVDKGRLFYNPSGVAYRRTVVEVEQEE